MLSDETSILSVMSLLKESMSISMSDKEAVIGMLESTIQISCQFRISSSLNGDFVGNVVS